MRIVEENQAPFMTIEFQKDIYTWSRLKNKMNKNPTITNVTAYKRQRNFLSNKKKHKIFLKQRYKKEHYCK